MVKHSRHGATVLISQGEMTMKKEAMEVLAIAKDLMAKYPNSTPTEKERKLWREQAEKRRRHEGIHPRK